jgi:hypothetical protein
VSEKLENLSITRRWESDGMSGAATAGYVRS